MPKESTVHKFSDLPNLKEMELEPWGLPKNWGLCVMGNSHVDQGIESNSCVLKFYEVVGDDVHEHLYPIPESVMVLMQHSAKKAERELQENFRKLMDI